MVKKIAIAGLGLIGGSFAKAIKQKTAHEVIGFDSSQDTLDRAFQDEAIDQKGNWNLLKETNILILALYPDSAIQFFKDALPYLSKKTLVVDLCGVKTYIFNQLSPLCKENGLVYIGAHPMAGRECSGYASSLPDLFKGASFILTPGDNADTEAVNGLTELADELGFSQCIVTTPEHHDEMIAYTSQLAHVVSASYIKSPRAEFQNGYSAGSYKDMTRVAKLNETMWSELFLENASPLLREIDEMILHLTEYRNAIAKKDRPLLTRLLKDSRGRKEQFG